MIAVVGSCNVDFVVPVAVLPGPGETVLGRDHLRMPGGKGANQSVAAAKLGSPVAFVGCVGDDALAPTILSALDGAGVDTSWLRRVPDAPSGIALITVADGGENTIAVSPGANARLGPADIEAAAGLLSEAAVTLVQLEISLDAVAAAVRTARGRVVLNPAPARSLPAELLASVDVLVPNRSELGVLAGAPEPTTPDEAAALAAALDGPAAVVVTLGADGALVVEDRAATHVPVSQVDAIDATGAGDAFCGALADALARAEPLVTATEWAVRVAGISTTRWGAQSSPTRDELS
ncbi:MAG: ribokinase [Actinophytocola sp.]|uniref:ribokinase n=1 Tax=Actinophytocola sp. TaxID=1872138 RepID=UPI003D6C6837